MKLFAPAKINLALDVLCKSASGYHEIRTVFQEIPSLADEIEITEAQKDLVTMKRSPHGPYPDQEVKMEDNIVHRALFLLKDTFQIKKSVKIDIKKKIPLASGLGGAASDAAAVVKGLNKLWNLNLSQEELFALAAKLGCDVPFFIVKGTALGTHFGEKITPLRPIRNIIFRIALPQNWPALPKIYSSGRQSIPAFRSTSPSRITHEVKTKSMYASLDLSKCGKNKEKTKYLLEGIEKEDKNLIIQNLHNDFETIVSVESPDHLSGSGPAAFTAI